LSEKLPLPTLHLFSPSDSRAAAREQDQSFCDLFFEYLLTECACVLPLSFPAEAFPLFFADALFWVFPALSAFVSFAFFEVAFSAGFALSDAFDASAAPLSASALAADIFMPFVFIVNQSAPVMHTDEYAPHTIPTISGSANSLMELTPMT